MSKAQDYIATVPIDIKTSAEATWEALTKPELIKRYMHNALVTTDWKVGSPITWEGLWQNKSYQDMGTILKYEPTQLLQYSHWSPLSGSENKPENYHIVTITLSQQSGTTRLTLSQSNNPNQEAADAMAANGWLPMLQSLKTLLET